jgi:hypothetical protein
MKKPFLMTAVLVLASSWALAQAAASQQPDKPQTAPSDRSGQTVEGCLSGAADTFVLTDASGYTYELTGDTRMLKENIGHKVRLHGYAGSSGGGEKITAQGPQRTFGVKNVESLSDTCK